MTNSERMRSGLPYKADDPELSAQRKRAKQLIYKYNNTPPERFDELPALAAELLGKSGKNLHLKPPFYCDYGVNIEIGDNFFSNFNLTILDVGRVKIGSNVLFGPNVSLYTAGHPVHPLSRASGYEYGIDIAIGDNVWLGGSVTVLPGVTIGNGAVIGAGSVVTHDIPDNVIACGNPCRVIREIAEDDRKYYFKDREFDVSDY